MGDTFFGLQVAVLAPPHDPWRARLATLLRQHQRDASLVDQRGLFGALANALREALPRCTLGFWDLVRDGAAEYGDWTRGIEDDSADPWRPDATGARMDHVLVSAMVLVPGGGPADLLLGERCDLPESEWSTRATYGRLFETLGMLPFANVRSDAVYLTPGGERLAFSLQELTDGEGYEYLLRIE